MIWPQQRNPQPTREATAPYNFVPLPSAVFLPASTSATERADHLPWSAERHHGVIRLTIRTETPLFTPCAERTAEVTEPDGTGSAAGDFYHHGDPARPVLPGSSLRGMIRALVAVISHARITRRRRDGRPAGIVDERLFYRGAGDGPSKLDQRYRDLFIRRRPDGAYESPARSVRAGYLRQAGASWAIQPARLLNGVPFARVPAPLLRMAGVAEQPNSQLDVYADGPAPRLMMTGTGPQRKNLLFAQTTRISLTPAAGLYPGQLIQSGSHPRRQLHTVVYAPDLDAAAIPIPQAMWDDFTRDQQRPRQLQGRHLSRDGDVCFYLTDEKGRLKQIGPSLFFRVSHDWRTGDFVPRQLTDGERWDMAELLFGGQAPAAGDAKNPDQFINGRIRVEDALCVGAQDGRSPFFGTGADSLRVLAPLPPPNPAAYQNYLVQPADGSEGSLMSYSDVPERNTVIRGSKIYWHRGQPQAEELAQPSVINAANPELPAGVELSGLVVRPVRAGVIFNGRLHFENLTDIELGALLSALELPSSCRHRLGMGKPFGMGTIAVSAAVELIDPQLRYQSLTSTGDMPAAASDLVLAEARSAFRAAIVAHHNAAMPESAVPADAELWDIPRLADLRVLLEWDNRPDRERTRSLTAEACRSRPVLPTPARVAGQPGLEPDAELVSDAIVASLDSQPVLPEISGDGRSEARLAGEPAPVAELATLAAPTPAPPEPPPPPEPSPPADLSVFRTEAPAKQAVSAVAAQSGVVSESKVGKVSLLLEDGSVLKMTPTPQIFPYAEWRGLTPAHIKLGQRVRVEIKQGKVSKVIRGT